MAPIPVPAALARSATRALLRAAGDPAVRVRLWTGDEVGAPPGKSVATVVVKGPAELVRLAADPDVQIGDLYVEGGIEVEGDLAEFIAALLRQRPKVGLSQWLPPALRELAMSQGLRTARRNAQHHYDVGNDFYAPWLDERMVYTCAYFPSPRASLEDAQLAKMDHVCRKLGLRAGDEVLEAGCGWGSLALHMARHYGVHVRACNVSGEQLDLARDSARRQGLADRVEFVEDDYRNLHGQYDAFVSVGMLEHVGPDHYADLGGVIERCLRPRGLAFLHSIGRSRPQPLNRWMRTRVFPNAHPPTLSEMMQIFEPRDLAVLDVENLRLHYRLTAWHWLRRFEAAWDQLVDTAGLERTRTWHFYLAGTVASFATATVQLYQVLVTRAHNDHIAWNRDSLTTGAPPLFSDEIDGTS